MVPVVESVIVRTLKNLKSVCIVLSFLILRIADAHERSPSDLNGSEMKPLAPTASASPLCQQIVSEEESDKIDSAVAKKLQELVPGTDPAITPRLIQVLRSFDAQLAPVGVVSKSERQSWIAGFFKDEYFVREQKMQKPIENSWVVVADRQNLGGSEVLELRLLNATTDVKQQNVRAYFRPFVWPIIENTLLQVESAQTVPPPTGSVLLDPNQTGPGSLGLKRLDTLNRAPRFTLAASSLNQRLGLHTVPHAKLISFQGRMGVLSDEAKGDPPAFEDVNFDTKEFRSIAKQSALDAWAFEFLVGNSDASFKNMRVEPSKREVQVFDHGHAFWPGILRVSWRNWGESLPPELNESFRENLEALTDYEIGEILRPLLSPIEIQGVLLRKKLLLQRP